MTGQGLYVWSVYAIGFAVLAWVALRPFLLLLQAKRKARKIHDSMSGDS